MKLLLDQGLPRSASDLLCKAGFDTVHVGDIGLASAEDTEILQKAKEDERVIITLDADFHTLLALKKIEPSLSPLLPLPPLPPSPLPPCTDIYRFRAAGLISPAAWD